MIKKLLSLLILLILILFQYEYSYSYFLLTHEDDKELTPGEWKFRKFEDPMNDDIIYEVYKNSNDREYGFNHTGSKAMLCIRYNNNTKKLSAFISLDAKPDSNIVPVLIRFGKNEPINFTLNLKEEDRYRIYINGLTILDNIKKNTRIAIKFLNPNNRAKEWVAIFDTNPEIFKKVAEPILKELN